MTTPGTPAPGTANADLADAVVVDFPLRGEGWVAVTSPHDRIPSHGTNLLGQRYAFDLLKVDDRRRLHDHPAGTLRGLLLGGRTQESYAWGAPIHSPFDGEIVRAVDGVAERTWRHPVRELALLLKNGVMFTPSRLPSILGNHVIVRREDLFAGFAHLAPGSVAVAEGQRIRAGQVIGRVGHTGNSTSPHLHFQLMDSADLLNARGVPCAFRRYDVLRDGAWARVENGIPGRGDRIRAVDPGHRAEKP